VFDVARADVSWVSYHSQNITSEERGRYRVYKIRQRLCVEGTGLPFAGASVPPRPIGMWNRTYHRSLKKLARAEEAVQDQYWERLCRLTERIQAAR
jgi:hypothetical protein